MGTSYVDLNTDINNLNDDMDLTSSAHWLCWPLKLGPVHTTWKAWPIFLLVLGQHTPHSTLPHPAQTKIKLIPFQGWMRGSKRPDQLGWLGP